MELELKWVVFGERDYQIKINCIQLIFFANTSILNRTNKRGVIKVQNLFTNWSLSQQPELGMGRLCIYFSMREHYDPSNVTPLGETDLM